MVKLNYDMTVLGRKVTNPHLVAPLQMVYGAALIVLVPVDYILRATGRQGFLGRNQEEGILDFFFRGCLRKTAR